MAGGESNRGRRIAGVGHAGQSSSARRASFNLEQVGECFSPRAVLFGLLLALTTFDCDPYLHDTGTRGTRLTGRRHGSGSSTRCLRRAAARHRRTCRDSGDGATSIRDRVRQATVMLLAPKSSSPDREALVRAPVL